MVALAAVVEQLLAELEEAGASAGPDVLRLTRARLSLAFASPATPLPPPPAGVIDRVTLRRWLTLADREVEVDRARLLGSPPDTLRRLDLEIRLDGGRPGA